MTSTEPVALFRDLFPERHDVTQSPLVVDRIGVQFGGLVAVRDVTFTMNRHENMSIVGQNGAGKSTLLNSISGLVKATPVGTVSVDGQVISRSPAFKRSAAGLGRAFQDALLVDDITCRENLLVGAHGSGGASAADQVFRPGRARRADELIGERADALLEFVGLTAHAEDIVGSLPYGARKLLDIARAMMSLPSVLLLDEPTSGLDKQEQETVKDLLLLIRRAEVVTVLMVEHHMDLVAAVSDRVLVLEAGTTLAIGTPDETLGITPTTTKQEGRPAQ